MSQTQQQPDGRFVDCIQRDAYPIPQELDGESTVASTLGDLPLFAQVLVRGQQLGSMYVGNLIEVCTRQAAAIAHLEARIVGMMVPSAGLPRYYATNAGEMVLSIDGPFMEADQVVQHVAQMQQQFDAKLADEELAHGKTIDQRDDYHQAADDLAGGVAEFFRVDVGEHSSGHCPWTMAGQILGGEYKTDSDTDRRVTHLLGVISATYQDLSGLKPSTDKALKAKTAIIDRLLAEMGVKRAN